MAEWRSTTSWRENKRKAKTKTWTRNPHATEFESSVPQLLSNNRGVVEALLTCVGSNNVAWLWFEELTSFERLGDPSRRGHVEFSLAVRCEQRHERARVRQGACSSGRMSWGPHHGFDLRFGFGAKLVWSCYMDGWDEGTELTGGASSWSAARFEARGPEEPTVFHPMVRREQRRRSFQEPTGRAFTAPPFLATSSIIYPASSLTSPYLSKSPPP